MKKVIQESVDRVDEKLSSILEGYVSSLSEVFTVDLQEACSKKKGMKEEEDDETCETCEVDPCECEDKEEVKENVIKNTGKEEVTYTKSKNPKKEKTSKFSKDGNKTGEDSGYEEEDPSDETPDHEGEEAIKDIKKKDNQNVPGKEGNSGKPVKEGYTKFKKDSPKLDSTKFTKDKTGTENKTPGFGEEKPSGKHYDKDLNRGAVEELPKDNALDDNEDAGFDEKDKPEGTALKAKKKRFPSKNPKVQGNPQAVKD